MTDGPDIAELQSNLLALGFGQRFGLIADGHYSQADQRATAAFAQAAGLPTAGNVLAFGSVVFEPGPVLVIGHPAPLGSAVSGGTPVVQVVGTTPQVVAEVSFSNGSLVKVGIPASITLDRGHPPLAGSVSAVSSTPPVGAGSSPAAGTAQGAGQGIFVTIGLASPPSDLPLQGTQVAVQLQTNVLHDVFIVPVTALVALVEGGYALQVDDKNGRWHLIPVTVGAIDSVDDLAQVNGINLREGLRVEMPAG
jgi:peptidoglycan hydrolase-like protein with peptidoglycan-binding domain